MKQRVGALLVAGALSLGLGVGSVLVAPPAGAASGVVAPLAAKTYSISSYYGPRCMPVARASAWHKGQDMGAASGRRINAIASGTVLRAGSISGFGQWVVIKHSIGGRTMSSLYGHVIDGDRYVRVGQKVKAGQRIADVGSTGTSTGPHLHLEIFKGTYGSGATNTDPIAYLKGQGVDLVRSATWAAARKVPSSCTYYAASKVNLRSGPSTGTSVRAVVPKAGKLTAKPGDASGTWRKVKYGSRTGWVSASYVTPRKPAVSSAATVSKKTATTSKAYVRVSALNLRSKASTSSSVLTTLKKGTAVTRVGSASKGWQKVKAGSRTGYVSASYLSSSKPATTSAAKAPAAPKAKTSYVRVSSLNLRAKASTSSKVLASLKKGTAVKHVGSVSKGWQKVKVGSKTGYVSVSYLSSSKPAATSASKPPKSTKAKTSYVRVTSLNLRAKATTSSKVLARLKKGTAVKHVGSVSKGWQKVKVGSKTGYVSVSYLSSSKPR